MRTPAPISVSALTAALALAGCAVPGGAPARSSVEVGGAPLAIAGPPGFCVDAASTRVDREGAFVLLSDCGLLGAGRSGKKIDAVLTASLTPSIGGAGVQPIADVGRFAGSAEGKALIGQGGDGSGVRILATRREAAAVFLLVEDRGRKPVAGIEPRFWRGFVEVDGRLAVLTVLAFEGGDVDAQKGLDLAAAFAAALQRANGT